MSDDVNASIRRWRDALACNESINTEKLDELQDHLEVEMKGIPAEGLGHEERVLLAARRVGAPEKLGREFFDADRSYVWRRRVLWMIVGLFVLGKLPSALMSLTTTMAFLANYFFAGPIGIWTGLGLTFVYAAIWAGLILFMWQQIRGGNPYPRLGRWVSTHRGWSIGFFLSILLGSSVLGSTGSMLLRQMNMFAPEEFSQLYLWQAYTALAISLVVPVALGVMAWSCYRRPSVSP